MSLTGAQVLIRATAEQMSSQERVRALAELANYYGWQPTDQLDAIAGSSRHSNGHLLVEHGLGTSAVITVLKSGRTFEGVEQEVLEKCLGISFNNLVEWHFFASESAVTAVQTRTRPLNATTFPYATYPRILFADSFAELTKNQTKPAFPDLDQSLIDSISFWKRALKADLGGTVTISDISNLFNALIFLRAIEDTHKWEGSLPADQRLLLDELCGSGNSNKSLTSVISKLCTQLKVKFAPFLYDGASARDLVAALKVFDAIDTVTLHKLFNAFYRQKYIPYEYDFAIISKHALSRIYERYVAALRETDSPQYSMFNTLPEEVSNRSLGAVYTPQFIARFFARAIKEGTAPRKFRELRALDPACGSGIFLRTLLEMRFDPMRDAGVSSSSDSFERVEGWDIDANACSASRLSLSLLHFALFREIPRTVNIRHTEALKEFADKRGHRYERDVVMANPPFIRYEKLDQNLKDHLERALDKSVARPDLYLGFLSAAMNVAAPDGFLCFVLPHNFLLAKNAFVIRTQLGLDYDILYLVDLSEIEVFEAVGAYVILLVAQKRDLAAATRPDCVMVKCRDRVGTALDSALRGKEEETRAFSVSKVTQEHFLERDWHVLSKTENKLWSKLGHLPRLSDFAEVKEGYISGADKVFVQPASAIPKRERHLWKPLLRDREMMFLRTPTETEKLAFYPFGKDRKKVSLNEVKDTEFTWQLISANKKSLSERGAVTKKYCEWWEPVWPRPPEVMLRPKVTCPHLLLWPKFSVDLSGKYVVSHSILIYPRDEYDTENMLAYLVTMLNSAVAFWQLQLMAHKYSRAYIRVEPMTVRNIRIPTPDDLSSKDMRTLMNNVHKIAGTDDPLGKCRSELAQLNEISLRAFDFAEAELRALGIYE